MAAPRRWPARLGHQPGSAERPARAKETARPHGRRAHGCAGDPRAELHAGATSALPRPAHAIELIAASVGCGVEDLAAIVESPPAPAGLLAPDSSCPGVAPEHNDPRRAPTALCSSSPARRWSLAGDLAPRGESSASRSPQPAWPATTPAPPATLRLGAPPPRPRQRRAARAGPRGLGADVPRLLAPGAGSRRRRRAPARLLAPAGALSWCCSRPPRGSPRPRCAPRPTASAAMASASSSDPACPARRARSRTGRPCPAEGALLANDLAGGRAVAATAVAAFTRGARRGRRGSSCCPARARPWPRSLSGARRRAPRRRPRALSLGAGPRHPRAAVGKKIAGAAPASAVEGDRRRPLAQQLPTS